MWIPSPEIDLFFSADNKQFQAHFSNYKFLYLLLIFWQEYKKQVSLQIRIVRERVNNSQITDNNIKCTYYYYYIYSLLFPFSFSSNRCVFSFFFALFFDDTITNLKTKRNCKKELTTPIKTIYPHTKFFGSVCGGSGVKHELQLPRANVIE